MDNQMNHVVCQIRIKSQYKGIVLTCSDTNVYLLAYIHVQLCRLDRLGTDTSVAIHMETAAGL